ncbi:MAG: molybdopterin-synthase adenylyltransferase MoeB [Candidatus Eisenbacteria bacterium]|uniref:Molybdopterin-synthase adenylyltransferase MoeB n=1 Tax=Eiseniibacteriota bacterium TaxID=2212470 RepID=A0A538U1D3_UNCEI|nr:MAG: molybdopterin-synthase adenylyltransferase MoeB [Candidatus Eisenbacteria bacterium]
MVGRRARPPCLPDARRETNVSDRAPLPDLSREELLRYSRHLILPEVGLDGQRRLKSSSVLVVGAGGLGSPLALYLTAAGVGRLGLVDFDRVDETNLQRQILHGTASVGRTKLESARARLADMNPHVQIDLHETRLARDNAFEILEPYDVVADGTDNFPTRYLVNDACGLLGKPNVHGSIFRFEGQVSVFDVTRGPCYRCLYPEPPPPGLVPSCAEGGVLGVLPGVIGVLQGIETIKLLLGIGEPLIGRLRRTVNELVDYEQFCGIAPSPEDAAEEEAWEIAPRELDEARRRGDLVLVDVREPHEHAIAHIEGARLMPLGTLPARVAELDSSRPIVIYCHHGQRSRVALDFMRRAGFAKIQHLRGGIDAWSREIDPTVPRY